MIDLQPLLPLLGNLRPKGKEYCVEICPFCKATEKDNKWKFYVSQESGAFYCQRGKCGAKGSLFQLKQKLGLAYNYTKPNIKVQPPTEIEQYWMDRQIQRRTLDMMKVAEKDGVTVFQYFMNGEIVLVKYRKQAEDGKHFWQELNGMPVLWNMDFVDTSKPLIITEGEPDAMSVYQSGQHNVVSIPFGSNNFDFIDVCRDFLSKVKTFILYLDNDEAGDKCKQTLIKRLGLGRCKIVNHELKDANEELMKYGIDYLDTVIKNARFIDVGDLEYFQDVPIHHKPETVKTGFYELDRALHEFQFGEVTVWTGKTSSGKSTILNQSILKAIESGFKVFVYSGEMYNHRIKDWLIRTVAGQFNLEKIGYDYVCKAGVLEQINTWIGENIIFFNQKVFQDSDQLASEVVLRKMEFAYQRDDCRIFVIDNIMTATLGGLLNNDFYQKQVVFMGQLISFASQYNSHIHVVIHQGKSRDMGTENISGMSQLSQLAGNALLVVRPDKDNLTPKGKFAECIEEEDARIEVLKCRESGSRKKILLKFEPISKRFYGDADNKDYQYPWKEKIIQTEIDFKDKQANDYDFEKDF